MRAGIYIRVSSSEQAEEGYSVGSQTDKLKAYCVAMEYDVYGVYTDPGYTGANINRPAMQQLIKDIEAKNVEIVLVMKLDRLSRSQKDTLLLIEDVFLKNGCDFVSITESFDTSSHMGRAFIGILAVFAQFERERISERTTDGKIERAKSGKAMAWQSVPIGYDYIDEKYIINSYESQLVKRIFNLAEEGNSMCGIKRLIDVEFSAGTKYQTCDGNYYVNTIRGILKNKVYYGMITFRGEVYTGVHEAIVTQEQFDKVQIIRDIKNRNAVGNRKNPFRSTHLLTGFIFCGVCGGRLHAQSRRHVNAEKSFYICYSKSKTAPKYLMDANCTLNIKDGQTLDEYVIDKICMLKSDKKYFNELTEEAKTDEILIDAIEIRIKGVENKMSKLMDLYLSDTFDKRELEKRNEKMTKEKKLLEVELQKAIKLNRKLTRKDAMKVIRNARDIFDNGDLSQQKELLATLIDRIIVTDTDIVIHWTFV